MGKDTKVKSAGADHGAKAAPAAPDTSHDFMARALLDDHTEPECIAQVLYDNQRYSNDIMAYVARTFGNDVLNQVIGAYAALQAAKPFGDDHAGASAAPPGTPFFTIWTRASTTAPWRPRCSPARSS